MGFRSINDGGIDTTTASGEMIFNIFGTLAQFERSLIPESTQARLTATRARERTGGRPKLSKDDPKSADGQKHEHEHQRQHRRDQ